MPGIQITLGTLFVGYHHAHFSCYFISEKLEEGSVPPGFGEEERGVQAGRRMFYSGGK